MGHLATLSLHKKHVSIDNVKRMTSDQASFAAWSQLHKREMLAFKRPNYVSGHFISISYYAFVGTERLFAGVFSCLLIKGKTLSFVTDV